MSGLSSYFETLTASILRANKENDVNELNILLYELTESSNIPDSLNYLIGPVTKLLPCQNSKVKKAVYSVLPRICAAHYDAALLIANRIIQDAEDPNPVVKCFAITALSLIPQLYEEHAVEILTEGLKDGNQRVRLSAVTGCENVFKHSPEFIKEKGFVDRLYGCIRDPDPRVVVACVLVLDSVLAIEGGIVINRSIAWYLLKKLDTFVNSQLATVFQVLLKYIPTCEEELFEELSLLDPYLVHTTSAAVIVNCVQLFLQLIANRYPQLKSEVLQRAIPVLKTYLMQNSCKESVKYIIDFLLRIDDHDHEWLEAFSNDKNLFYPNEEDDITIAVKKIKILPRICNDDNFKEILEALEKLFCRRGNYSEHAIKCMSLISNRVPSSNIECIRILMSLLDSNNFQVSSNVVNALKDFNFLDVDVDDKEIIFEKVLSKVNLGNKGDIAQILPVLTRDFEDNINKCSYVLENLAENFLNYDLAVRCLIVSSIVKLFFRNPGKHQHTLGEVLKKSIIDKNMGWQQGQLLNREKALKYYCLLKSDVTMAKRVLSLKKID